MEFNFEKFINTGGRYENRITITSSRSIGFPSTFYNEHKLSEFKYAVLFYDTQKLAIGIQFINDENEKHKFTIIRSKQGYGGSIVATSFFKKYNIDAVKYKGRYEWKKTETDYGSLYVIELKER